MSEVGNIVIARPGDIVLQGDQLSDLTERLAPRGLELVRLLGGVAASNGSIQNEAEEQCKLALLEVVDFFDEPILTPRTAQKVIKACWEPTFDNANPKVNEATRLKVDTPLVATIWNLMNGTDLKKPGKKDKDEPGKDKEDTFFLERV